MTREQFEDLVEEAVKSLPRAFRKRLDNVVFQVSDQAGRDTYSQTGTHPLSSILGIYHGVPYQYRGPYYGNMPPDVIVIYQKPIESICRTEEEVRDKVLEVVIHEVGHYFGMTDAQLHDIEDQIRRKVN